MDVPMATTWACDFPVADVSEQGSQVNVRAGRAFSSKVMVPGEMGNGKKEREKRKKEEKKNEIKIKGREESGKAMQKWAVFKGERRGRKGKGKIREKKIRKVRKKDSKDRERGKQNRAGRN